MTQYLIFLLPLGSLFILLSYSLFPKEYDMQRTRRSRRWRVIILQRLTVITLPVAAAIAYLLPFSGLDKFLAALVISAIVITPIFLWHLWASKATYKTH